MNANNISLQLIRESLFCQQVREDERLVSSDVWDNVYKELQSQAVLGIVSDATLKKRGVPVKIREEWRIDRYSYLWKCSQANDVQEKVCELLEESGLKVAVMKGAAAAIYYPVPMVRGMGDIDLLVKPDDYKKAIKILSENGYNRIGAPEGRYHTIFIKDKVEIELHRSPSGIHRYSNGDRIREYIISGLDLLEISQLGDKKFPILPWKQNGMELLWHIRQHLYNGLGLRQIIDWMMFVYNVLDDERMMEYMPDLEYCGLDHLAVVVTKMCQKYLGLTNEKITWCDSAEEELCDYLIKYIFAQGDFGSKAFDEKTAKVLSGYQDPKTVMAKLQMIGEDKWKVLRKHPCLKPLAFVYGTMHELIMFIRRENGIKKALKDIRLGRYRARMLSRIFKSNNRSKTTKNHQKIFS